MDSQEYRARVLGEGTKIDLGVHERDADEKAVLISLEDAPYETALDRITNKVQATKNNPTIKNKYPVYLQIADGDAFDLDGEIELTLRYIHEIDEILKYAKPSYYAVNDGEIGDEITKKDLIGTLKFKNRTTIHDIVGKVN